MPVRASCKAIRSRFGSWLGVGERYFSGDFGLGFELLIARKALIDFRQRTVVTRGHSPAKRITAELVLVSLENGVWIRIAIET
jgi:hypothetical protein